MNFEIGESYDAVINGQLHSFIFEGVDSEDENFYSITWYSRKSERVHKTELELNVKAAEILDVTGVIYPRGRSEEDQFVALCMLINHPSVHFGGKVVPRAVVLNKIFSPEDYPGNEDYMSFTYDSDKSILTAVSTISEVNLPEWLANRFEVIGAMKISPQSNSNETIWKIHLDEHKLIRQIASVN